MVELSSLASLEEGQVRFVISQMPYLSETGDLVISRQAYVYIRENDGPSGDQQELIAIRRRGEVIEVLATPAFKHLEFGPKRADYHEGDHFSIETVEPTIKVEVETRGRFRITIEEFGFPEL